MITTNDRTFHMKVSDLDDLSLKCFINKCKCLASGAAYK